jgi:dTDP-D-glucose 4,6-dehydratase
MSRTTPTALLTVLDKGRLGESYNIGGNAEAQEHRPRDG